MSPSDDPYRPRPDDHLVEPLFSGLGLEDQLGGKGQAAELRPGVDPEREPPGRLYRWIRSARGVMRGALPRPGRDR